MQQTDCNGILPCSDPGQHKLVLSANRSDPGSAQRLGLGRLCGPDPWQASGGTGVDEHYRPPARLPRYLTMYSIPSLVSRRCGSLRPTNSAGLLSARLPR